MRMQMTHSLSDIRNYMTSLRDSIKYPLVILLFNVGCAVWSGMTAHDAVDYIVSCMILPIVVVVSDYIPPHIPDNYTLGANPGIKRIAKVGIFILISAGVMFGVHVLAAPWFSSEWVVQSPDAIERASRIMYQVGDSLKFLP